MTTPEQLAAWRQEFEALVQGFAPHLRVAYSTALNTEGTGIYLAACRARHAEAEALREHYATVATEIAEAMTLLELDGVTPEHHPLEQNVNTIIHWANGIKCRNEALRAENKRLRGALEPFATADADCVAVGIRPEDTYLWKPQSNTREMRGIHMRHILAARDALANKTGEPK